MDFRNISGIYFRSPDTILTRNPQDPPNNMFGWAIDTITKKMKKNERNKNQL